MEKVEFSNGITYGAMYLDKEWLSLHNQIEDKYELYLAAEKDENSRMVLLYILDVGKKTVDCIKS